MRRVSIIALIFGLLAGTGIQAQQDGAMTDDMDRQFVAGLPRLALPAGYSTKSLPYKKDNTRLKYFSDIYNQEVWNCNQAASIWTMFTYEINFLRDLDSKLPENQYSPMAVFNLLNYGNPGQGVSYFDSWKVIRENGIMSHPDFPVTGQNSQLWVTGYDKYYRGMRNRVDQVYAIDVGTPEGLLTLKHWINDHMDGSEEGGLANFQIGSGDMVIRQIPLDEGLEEEGQLIMVKYGPYVGHAMTFAGWNDQVRYDFNGDGRYTNDIDINGDKLVDMKDWEIGAMLVVNSWGTLWGNAGKIWVPYRLLAEDTHHGGIWGNSVTVIRPKKSYQPLLTAKIGIKYDLRDRLKIRAGVALDPGAREPDKVLDFTCFSFQGGSYPMQGIVSADNQNIEIGLDLTPLLNEFLEDGEAKIFLEIIQRSPDNTGTGSVNSFSVITHHKGQTEYSCTECPVDIQRNGLTRLSVVVTSDHLRPEIWTWSLPTATAGEEYSFHVEAGGSSGPYKWNDPSRLFTEKPVTSAIGYTGGEKILPDGDLKHAVKDLPFGIPFYGKAYGQMTVLSDGGILMGNRYLPYPYVIDSRLPVYQNTGIFPFFRNLYYPGENFGVTMESSDGEVIVRWRASLDSTTIRPVEFAARILPGGVFEFHYGSMDVVPGDSWISAVSEGDMMHVHLLGHNFTNVQDNTAFQLEPIDWPAGMTLSQDGLLSGIPQESGEWYLPFEAVDNNGLIVRSDFRFTVRGGSLANGISRPEEVAIYPNPVRGEAWLKIDSGTDGGAFLHLYDLNGRMLITETCQLKPGKNMIRIRGTAGLEPGVYLYRLSGSLTSSGRILVQQ